MQNSLVSFHKKVKKKILFPQIYLIGITVGFAILNIILIYQQNNNSDQLIFTVLPWLGVIILLWQKKDQVPLNSDYISTLIGMFFIFLVVSKSVSLFWFEASLIKVMPLLSIIGLFLIVSGFKGLKYYLREIFMILILAVPNDSLERIINEFFQVNIITAKFTSILLWYSGYQVSNEGDMIHFPDVSVFVDYPCTGVKAILILLKLSVLLICLFNHNWKISSLLITSSIVIGFVLGVFRASFLALIVRDQELFDYWHGPDGGSIFATASMIVFAIIYNLLIPKLNEQKISD